jgi:hypothetical protein
VSAIRIQIAVLLIAAASAGCEKKGGFDFLPTSPAVEWKAISKASNGAAHDGYRVLVTGKTQGVFPVSMGVARVRGIEQDAETARIQTLELDVTPQVDFLSWNSVLDDLRFVSEVFPLNPKAMDGAPVSVETILDAARALKARTCLIYAEVHDSVYESQVRGALYEVATGRQLASVHALAHVDNPIALDDEDDYEDLAAEREARDPRLVALRQFEQHFRDCLLYLSANDEQLEPVTPEGWVPENPDPAVWPPPEEQWWRYMSPRP